MTNLSEAKNEDKMMDEHGHAFKERLDSDDLSWSRDHIARYRFAMQWAPGARVLDVCCGIGYGSFILAAAGAVCVQGVDISEEAIGRAKEQPALPNLSFALADACAALPNSGGWDLVTCFEGIEHVPDPKKLVDQIYRSLAPGGIAVMSTPNSDAFGGHSGNPWHLSEMTEAQFRGLIGGWNWSAEWYAQVDSVDIWNRPAWQRPVLRTLRSVLRRNTAKPKVPMEAAGKPAGAEYTVDDWYPMAWDKAMSVMYQPPPELIIAVCRKDGLK